MPKFVKTREEIRKSIACFIYNDWIETYFANIISTIS